MNKTDYSISTIIFETAKGNAYTQYRGRVITPAGYWKLSKEFDTKTQAYDWCEQNMIKL